MPKWKSHNTLLKKIYNKGVRGASPTKHSKLILFIMSKDKVFADGFLFKRRENAPDFVIGNISVKVEEAVLFLKTHQKNGWVNLNVLTSQAGKPYVELDTFVPKKQDDAPVKSEEKTADLPF
tara:strand:- start:27 stop:392 length:366 start_codon:yes stop_codon:yes gene_type:complete